MSHICVKPSFDQARWLIEVGIRAEVLTLRWPENVQPLELPNFESQARKFRYQALGTACKERGIQALLLGHHADDQAETVLMRLANGHRGRGLRGMNVCSEIPECWGMHGVHLSGAVSPMEAADQKGAKHYDKRKPKKQKMARDEAGDTELLVEAGGIKVYRPLLGFSKDQLIATCRANKTPWVEDHTNHDPTLTPRNAIRSLLQGSSLPLALQRSSLVGLSRRSQHKEDDRAKRVEKLFRACEIIDFHTRSGTLTIRFPKLPLERPSTDPLIRNRQTDRAGYLAPALLKRALELVTPQEVVRLRDLGTAVRTIFPDPPNLDSTATETETETESTPASPPTAFTVANVYCQPIPLPLPLSTPSPNTPLNPTHAWLLSRQPYSSPPTTPHPTCTFPPAPPHGPSALTPPWSDWQLFDGRFWIRVQNARKINDTLVVRPFAQRDLAPFRKALNPTALAKFDRLLNEQAPGGVRWTLPVLARERDGRMVAAVSLGVGLARVEVEGEGGVEWGVRYRAVDLPVGGRGDGRQRERKGGGRRARRGVAEKGGEGAEGQ